MSAKLVLYFTASEHVLYRWAGGGLVLEARFPADDSGLEEFRAHLRGRRGSLVYVVADLAGEDFHEDQIPYLRGSDRQAVVQRRLAQRYRDTRLAAAISLGIATGERRNERLLLASFTNTQQFTAWLDALAESGARLSGVYSAPLLAPALAARLGTRSGRCFVVSANSAGLRQCYVEDGRLRFARLERMSDMAPEALAAFVRAETLRLLQYLSTLRALPREGPPIQVLVLAPAAERAAYQQALVSDTRLAFHTIALEEAAKKAGIKRLPAGAGGEQLTLHLAVRQPPSEQFARLEDRRAFVLWRLQRAIATAGAVGFLACALFAGWHWLDLMAMRDQVATQKRAAKTASDSYQRITASFPVTQTTTENLKATVVEFTKVATQSASPEPALLYLSRVMEKFPQMEVESVGWRVSRAGERGEAAAAGESPAAKAAAAATPGESLQILEVTGRVHAIKRSDYRAITEEVQRFERALAADPGWRVLGRTLPFDVTSEGTLSGEIGTGDGAEAPRFTILVGRPLK
jgi:hypothetical protein